MVGFGKLGSWYLLLWVAFATVTAVLRGSLSPTPLTAIDVAPDAPPRQVIPERV
jgi:hypothetical protein